MSLRPTDRQTGASSGGHMGVQLPTRRLQSFTRVHAHTGARTRTDTRVLVRVHTRGTQVHSRADRHMHTRGCTHTHTHDHTRTHAATGVHRRARSCRRLGRGRGGRFPLVPGRGRWGRFPSWELFLTNPSRRPVPSFEVLYVVQFPRRWKRGALAS